MLRCHACAAVPIELEEGHDAIRRLASGGIPVGLVMAHSRGAPLTHARAHLAKWPFTAFEVVASERLLCQTLRQEASLQDLLDQGSPVVKRRPDAFACRQVADGLGTAPEHTALCGRLPHIQLSQAWRAINGRLPILESLHGLESTVIQPEPQPVQNLESRMPCMCWGHFILMERTILSPISLQQSA